MTPALTASLLILANTADSGLTQTHTESVLDIPTLGAMEESREMEIHVVIEGPEGHMRVIDDHEEYEIRFDPRNMEPNAALRRLIEGDHDHHNLQDLIHDLVRQGASPQVNRHQRYEMHESPNEREHHRHNHHAEQWLQHREHDHREQDHGNHHHRSHDEMEMMRHMAEEMRRQHMHEEMQRQHMHEESHHDMGDDYAAQAMQFAHKIEVSREIGARLDDQQAMAIFGVWQAREHIEPDRRIEIMRSIAHDDGIQTPVRNAAEWVLMEAYWQVGDDGAAAETLEAFIRRNGS